jgi:hypothetical protein
MKVFFALWAAFVILVGVAASACDSGELGVRDVSPGTGILGGNEPVKIEGSGFRQGMGIDVYFGNAKSPAVIVEGTNRLLVTTPPMNNTGPVDIRIVTDQGDNIIVRNAFTFVESQTWDLTEGFAGTKKRR